MAARVALLTFQLTLVALSRRHRESIAQILRTVSLHVYGRQLKPWQVRAYRRTALVIIGVTILYDAVFLVGAALR